MLWRKFRAGSRFQILVYEFTGALAYRLSLVPQAFFVSVLGQSAVSHHVRSIVVLDIYWALKP